MTTIPRPAHDDPCLRVSVETRFGEVSQASELIDAVGWEAISALVTADDWTGGGLTEQVPVLDDEAQLAQWCDWVEVANDPVLANAALKTAVSAAVAAGQECKAWMRVSRALIALLKNGAPE